MSLVQYSSYYIINITCHNDVVNQAQGSIFYLSNQDKIQEEILISINIAKDGTSSAVKV